MIKHSPLYLLFLSCCLAATTTHAATVQVPAEDVAALAAALAAAQPGDIVQLAAGTYALHQTIHPKTGTHLLGAGMDKTILRWGSSKKDVMLELIDVTDVELSQLTFDAADNPLVQRPVFASNCKRLNLHHLAIRNTARKCGSPAIHFSGHGPKKVGGVIDSVIANCVFENIGLDSGWGCGIRFSYGSSRNAALNNTIRNTGRGGILADNGSADLIIRGNTVTGSGGEGLGIEVWEGCDRSIIEDNVIDHWLSIGGSDWCAVRRNVVSDKSGTAKFIGIEGIGAYCIYTDNRVDDGQMIGLSVSDKQPKNYCYYGNNLVRSCIQWAAQFQGEKGGIAYNYLYRCIFEGTTVGRGKPPYPGDEGHGFRINGQMRQSVFEECEFRDNGRCGLQAYGPNTDRLSFISCRITGNKGAAVTDLHNYSALEWENCTVTGNGKDNPPAPKPFATPRPTASITGPANAKPGEKITFSCVSPDATDSKTVIVWDPGDGAPLTGQQVTHEYSRPGQFTITAILWDKNGRGVRASHSLQVR